ncbi:Par3/HAL N-terminal [Trinorchestia longiramus]|nr:Par3/HAL N-terminal [Trinorchestia longiramus]
MRDRSYDISTLASETHSKNIISLNNNNYHNDKNINDTNSKKTNQNNLKNGRDLVDCGVRRQDSCVIINKFEDKNLAEVHGDGSTAATTPIMSLTTSSSVVTVNGCPITQGTSIKSTSVSNVTANHDKKFVSKTSIVDEDDSKPVGTDILSVSNKDDSGDSGYGPRDAELEIGVAVSPETVSAGEPDLYDEKVTKMTLETGTTGTSLQFPVSSETTALKVPIKSSSHLYLPVGTETSLEIPVEAGTALKLATRGKSELDSEMIDKQARVSPSDVQMTINGQVIRHVDSGRRTSKDKLTSRLSASKEKLFYSKEKLFSSKEKLFSGSKEGLFSSREKIFSGSKEKFSFSNGRSSTLKNKFTSADGSCHQTLKVQYSDVVGVANKLSKIFCRSRSQTYNLQRKEKGMSLPASFSQTTGNWVTIANLRQLDGGILDLDDRLCDVVDDRDQIIAVYTEHCPRKGDGPAGAPHPSRNDNIPSAVHSRSHTPDIFQVGERDYGSGLNTTDIEVTGEELNNTPPPLHVRRGSEPTLNRLSPIPVDPTGEGGPSPLSVSHTVVGAAKKGVHNKRWSAAPVVDNDAVTPPSSTPLKIHDPHERVFVYPGEERGEGSGEEKNPSSSASSSASSHHSATGTAFSRFARDANRCSVQASVLSDNPTMTRWADAAERVGGSGMSYNEMRRRDPVGGASTSPHHSRQASLDIRHSEDTPASTMFDKTNSSYNNKNNLYIHHNANGAHAGVLVSPAGYKNSANGETIYGNNKTGFPLGSRNSSERLYDEGKAGRDGSYGGSSDGSIYLRHDRSHSHDSADVRYYKRQDQSQYLEQETGQGRQQDASETFSGSQDSSGTRENLYGPPSHPYASVEDKVDNSSKEERILVVLNNGCGPLGIHVIPSPAMGRGGEQGSGGLLVEGVEEGGRVAQDGRIEVHDRIVDINGHSLLNTTFHQAQEIFKDAMQASALRLLVSKTRSRAAAAAASTPATVTATTAKPTSLSARTQAAMLASASRRPGRLISLCLTKGPHGLGFSITTRDNPARGHAPIYIKSVLPKGAAIEEGTLRIGDKLVSVNGKEVTGLSQTEVANMLRKIPVGGRAVLEVSRQERGVDTNPGAAVAGGSGVMGPGAGSGTEGTVLGDVKDRLKDDHPPSPQLPRPIGIEKSWEDSLMFPWKQRELITFNIPVHDSERAGLGVSVKGKTSSGSHGSNGPVDLGIFVKNVICGGAASRDGRLRENDQLVNINGLSLLGKPNSEAMTTLRIAMHQEGPIPGMITLTIARRMVGAQAQLAEGGEQYSNSLPRSGRDSSNSGSTGNETIGYLGGTRTAPTTPTPYEGLSTDYTSGRFPPNNSTPCGDPLSSVLHNPVLHRLTGNTAALRNDSYYQATHDTWNNSELAAALPPSTSKPPREACVGGEEGTGGSSPLGSPTVNLPQRDTLLIQDEYPSATAGSGQLVTPASCLDDTYNSQTSLEGSGMGGGFSRDQFGRQSMSEKRHATLDAKSTDTYQRNKKVREERERQKQQQHSGEKLSGTNDLPPRPVSSALLRSPSSPPAPPRRFSPHHSLPGYVRRVGMSPLATTISSPSKNTFTLPRSPQKLGVAKAVQGVFAGKTSSSAGAKVFSPNSRIPSPIFKRPAAVSKGNSEKIYVADSKQTAAGRRTSIIEGKTIASSEKTATAGGKPSSCPPWDANAWTKTSCSRNKGPDSSPKVCHTSTKFGRPRTKVVTAAAEGNGSGSFSKSYVRQVPQAKTSDESSCMKQEPSTTFAKRASSGKGERLGGEGGFLGLLRGVSRSLERPHPSTNCQAVSEAQEMQAETLKFKPGMLPRSQSCEILTDFHSHFMDFIGHLSPKTLPRPDKHLKVHNEDKFSALKLPRKSWDGLSPISFKSKLTSTPVTSASSMKALPKSGGDRRVSFAPFVDFESKNDKHACQDISKTTTGNKFLSLPRPNRGNKIQHQTFTLPRKVKLSNPAFVEERHQKASCLTASSELFVKDHWLLNTAKSQLLSTVENRQSYFREDRLLEDSSNCQLRCSGPQQLCLDENLRLMGSENHLSYAENKPRYHGEKQRKECSEKYNLHHSGNGRYNRGIQSGSNETLESELSPNMGKIDDVNEQSFSDRSHGLDDYKFEESADLQKYSPRALALRRSITPPNGFGDDLDSKNCLDIMTEKVYLTDINCNIVSGINYPRTVSEAFLNVRNKCPFIDGDEVPSEKHLYLQKHGFPAVGEPVYLCSNKLPNQLSSSDDYNSFLVWKNKLRNRCSSTHNIAEFSMPPSELISNCQFHHENPNFRGENLRDPLRSKFKNQIFSLQKRRRSLDTALNLIEEDSSSRRRKTRRSLNDLLDDSSLSRMVPCIEKFLDNDDAQTASEDESMVQNLSATYGKGTSCGRAVRYNGDRPKENDLTTLPSSKASESVSCLRRKGKSSVNGATNATGLGTLPNYTPCNRATRCRMTVQICEDGPRVSHDNIEPLFIEHPERICKNGPRSSVYEAIATSSAKGSKVYVCPCNESFLCVHQLRRDSATQSNAIQVQKSKPAASKFFDHFRVLNNRKKVVKKSHRSSSSTLKLRRLSAPLELVETSEIQSKKNGELNRGRSCDELFASHDDDVIEDNVTFLGNSLTEIVLLFFL